MPFELWYTAVILVVMSVALFREWIETELILFAALLALLAGGIIDLKSAVAGFSNQGMLTVALLFIVAGALQYTGAIRQISPFFFGKNPRPGSTRSILRVLLPVTALSAFINNTPLVAILIPAIRSWSEKTGVAASKYLIPISFAAILGGMCTLIGTSTNLIIYGLMLDFGMPGMTMFELSYIGVPIAVAGLIYLVFIGHRLLPEHKEFMQSFDENTREFVIVLKVTDNYNGAGQTVEKAGLRHLNGLFLFQIERKGRMIAPVRPDGLILAGDRLYFTGLPRTILELQKTPGLELLKDAQFDLKQYDSSMIHPYEAVISASSPLLGKNVRNSRFREKFDAVIVAIHRNGERLRNKIGDVILQEGDTLLLLSRQGFYERWYNSNDFYLISEADGVESKPRWQSLLSILILVPMIILVVTRAVPIIFAAAFSVLVLMVTKTISREQARRSVDIRVLVIIASAFGIAEAMKSSGLADFIAQGIINTMGVMGIVGIMAGIFIVASLYTNIMTNNAAAAIVFPIAFAVAHELQMDPRPFIITLAIAASTSFMTPISYQTNLMVYGPGRYKATDFLKVGLPLQVIVSIVAIALIYLIYF
ncbi:MAG: anion permease [Flavobacteriales bacterium]|nr:anion permease [Flavobacteriales bacterium]